MMKAEVSKKIRRRAFTMVELIVSMAVFALLSMMVVRLFSASQKLWVSNNQKNAISAEGRTALNLIAALLSNACAAPEIHAQTSSTSSKDTVYKGGNDYLELDQDDNGNSKLYFATKTNHPGIKDSNSSVSACFVGVQIVKITDESDPDYHCNPLVMTVKTDTDSSVFPDQFPKSTSDIKSKLNGNEKSTYSDGGTKVSRIATGVVSFNAWLCYGSGDIEHNNNSTGATTRALNSTSDYPVAIELELVLMDRAHFLLYHDATDDEKTNLRNQYGRTFRKLVWLGNDRHTDDYEEYYGE